jgi:hypothetical protein
MIAILAGDISVWCFMVSGKSDVNVKCNLLIWFYYGIFLT